jgi:predicted branched-subunit amino acid permease
MLRSSMGIALYAMFVALLVPQVKKSKPILVMALCAGAFNSLLNALDFLPQSWCLLIAIVSVSLGGTFLIKGEEREGEENE